MIKLSALLMVKNWPRGFVTESNPCALDRRINNSMTVETNDELLVRTEKKLEVNNVVFSPNVT